MKTIKEKQKEAFAALREKMGYTNPMQAPRIMKVSVGVGTGSFKDKKKFAVVEDRLAKITGQKSAPRGAKKSIASFKVRQGDTVGYVVTLRGARMYGFLEKLLAVALPRTRDFRGISPAAIDESGNLTIGIREHTIFPEASDEDLRDVFGMAVTVVTTARDRDEARTFFEYLGFPFAKKARH
ncbi:MAG: large subunit ribosomal protein L5 [Parcubacteria group bacterium Greene0416_79]|nr:MAG: large subunit ribosomal protein L5 [Parcubacteria group bacterium Greene0416_79]